MLRMSPRTSAASTVAYHFDNPHEVREQTTAWGGRGAARLGLSGEVRRDHFAALCENTHPFTGERLTVRTKSHRRVAYDFNFNPPKSVSVVHAFKGDDRIVRVCEEAVRETLEFIEGDAAARVRSAGRDEDSPTGNLVCATFGHQVTRPVNGVPDPHLHWHCLVFNATFDETEERWKAVQFGELKSKANVYQARFHELLARKLRSLGYELEMRGTSFEIAGVPETVLRKFSSRRAMIEEEAARRGQNTPKMRDALGMLTREPKRHDLSPEERRSRWMERLTPEDHAALDRFGINPVERSVPKHDPTIEPAAIAYAKSYCLDQQSVAPEWEFVAAAMRFGTGRLDPDILRERFVADPSIVRRVSEGRTLWTTTLVIHEERKVVDWAIRGKGTQPTLAPWHQFPATLSDEQRRAAESVVNSRDRLTAIVGRAGTGKTSLMRETIRAIEEAGTPVVVAAPYSNMARVMLRKEGFPDANTLRTVNCSQALREKARNGVLWVDEAGLLSMQDMQDLLSLADRLNARLVLSGDTRQHHSVKRGDAFRLLLEHAEIERAELVQNRRQKGAFKEVIDELAEQRVIEALQKLDAQGGIIEMEGSERHEWIADRYMALRKAGEDPLIISPTHAEGNAVTRLVRARMRAEGLLKEERSFTHLRRVDLRDADQVRPAAYELGWIVEMVLDTPTAPKGTRSTIASVTPEAVHVRRPDGHLEKLDLAGLSGKYHVYEPVPIRLAVGDEIRITQGARSITGTRMESGAIHKITGFGPHGTIGLDSGAHLAEDFGHCAWAYVSTSYVAQGRTVRHVLVAEGIESFPAASREQIYVSLSRGKFSGTIVTSDKEGLFEAAERSSGREMASFISSSSHRGIAVQQVCNLLR